MPRVSPIAVLTFNVGLLACSAPGSNAQKLDKPLPAVWSDTANGVKAELQLHEARNTINFQTTPADARASAKAALLGSLFGKMLAERGRQREYLLTVGHYPELNDRLAGAAVCAANSAQPPGEAVRDLLNEKALFPELERAFAASGYAVRVKQAEGIMLCPWSSMKLATPQGCKASPDLQVPCGASLVFQLTASR